jgi:hypothetical protein
MVPNQTSDQKEKTMSQSSTVPDLYYPGTKNLATVGIDGPQPRFLLDDNRLKVILAGLEPG